MLIGIAVPPMNKKSHCKRKREASEIFPSFVVGYCELLAK